MVGVVPNENSIWSQGGLLNLHGCSVTNLAQTNWDLNAKMQSRYFPV